MPSKIIQYSTGRENLYYFYRFVILPWELNWNNCSFLVSNGNLKAFCKLNNINLKSYESTDKLNIALKTEYTIQEKNNKGMLWFVRVDTKPKDTLRHLRNCFSHGNFIKRQKNKESCIVIKNIDKGRIKAQGFIPLGILKLLIQSLESCKV